MRPDRIILGEVRSGEAFDMLQAMNTGHDGSMTTVHANTPRDALTAWSRWSAMAGLDLPTRSIRAQIASAIHVVIQLKRFSDGSRRVVSIQEVEGMEGETITMQEIFRFEQTGVMAAFGAVTLSVAVAAIWIAQRRASRLCKLEDQLPLSLDIMVRALKAGHPVVSAVNLVTQEMPDPIGTEFGIVMDETTYGGEFKDALRSLATRTGPRTSPSFRSASPFRPRPAATSPRFWAAWPP
jgi:predicted aspartyl protease